MSFSADVKEELSKINIFSNENIVKAELLRIFIHNRYITRKDSKIFNWERI